MRTVSLIACSTLLFAATAVQAELKLKLPQDIKPVAPIPQDTPSIQADRVQPRGIDVFVTSSDQSCACRDKLERFGIILIDGGFTVTVANPAMRPVQARVTLTYRNPRSRTVESVRKTVTLSAARRVGRSPVAGGATVRFPRSRLLDTAYGVAFSVEPLGVRDPDTANNTLRLRQIGEICKPFLR